MPAESKLQKKILADLKKKGWEVVKITLCNQNGWPDITAYKNKRTLFIEAKAPKKAANPLQQYRHECLRAQGFEVYVTPTWEQYKWIKL
jgi:Holliday junction resolvase